MRASSAGANCWASARCSPAGGASRCMASDSGAPDPRCDLRNARLQARRSARSLASRLVLVPAISPRVRAFRAGALARPRRNDEREAGVRAWIDRYGLLLAVPPRTPSGRCRKHARAIYRASALAPSTTSSRLDLRRRKVFVCPFTPNVWRFDMTSDSNATPIGSQTCCSPQCAPSARLHRSAAQTGIDGCSLGGFIGLEVFLRRPAMFAAWGGVQSALGEGAAPSSRESARERPRKAGPRRLHIETSTGDPFYRGQPGALPGAQEEGHAHDLAVLPGPHDQPFCGKPARSKCFCGTIAPWDDDMTLRRASSSGSPPGRLSRANQVGDHVLVEWRGGDIRPSSSASKGAVPRALRRL